MDRGDWQATVHGVTEADTTQQLNNDKTKGLCISNVAGSKKDSMAELNQAQDGESLSCYLPCVFILNKFLVALYIWPLILRRFVECTKHVEKNVKLCRRKANLLHVK